MQQSTPRTRRGSGRRTVRRLFLLAALAAAAGCSASDSVFLDVVVCPNGMGPECVAGGLDVTVQGLPSELYAAVTITGPNGFNLSLTASRRVQLLPGEYTITAEPVHGMSVTYDPEQSSQVISVSGAGDATATVTYVEIQDGA